MARRDYSPALFSLTASHNGKTVRRDRFRGLAAFTSFSLAASVSEVFLCRDIVDFRKGINGLTILVEEALSLDPFSEQLFIFCNRKRNMVRILYWECNGFCLWQMRLEKAKFKWPRKSDSEIIILTGQQINWLLDGYDVMKMKPHDELKYSTVL